ncbi:MAG: hypothetical protein V7K98_15990 [Nostoc sp.]|uniref:hypothetical protein n=1 Tax=Nostoc sp. TaxID=1180 RepID=UPI002FFB577E
MIHNLSLRFDGVNCGWRSRLRIMDFLTYNFWRESLVPMTNKFDLSTAIQENR